MNVASLEPCKELYELSGWKETYFYHIQRSGDLTKPEYWGDNVMVGDLDEALRWTGKRCSAYDLGYLLRKLPLGVGVGKYVTWDMDNVAEIKYLADLPPQETARYADTPEDAVAKLCIELFKQGILTKET